MTRLAVLRRLGARGPAWRIGARRREDWHVRAMRRSVGPAAVWQPPDWHRSNMPRPTAHPGATRSEVELREDSSRSFHACQTKNPAIERCPDLRRRDAPPRMSLPRDEPL